MFHDHPEITTQGFYCFVPDDTPHFDGFHNFGSRNWTSDERDPEPLLGEVTTAKQSWMNGAPRGAFAAATFIGTRSCIEKGESWPLPVIDREFIGGWDSRCGLRPPPVDPPPPLMIDVQDCRFQAQLADTEWGTYFTGSDDAATTFQGFYPTAVCTTVPNSSSIFPGSMIAVVGNTTVVFISGTQNPQQWALQVMFGAVGITNYGTYSTLGLWKSAADALVRRITDANGSTLGPIIFVGHSYGGAVACLLAYRYSIEAPDRDVQLLTFGCPRPGDQRLVDQLNRLRQVHLVNDDDPVTFIPPAGFDAYVIGSVIPSSLLALWSDYVRPSARIGQRTDGSRFDNPEADSMFALLFNLVLQAATGQVPAAITAHQMSEYRRRIVCPPQVAPSPIPPPGPLFLFKPSGLDIYNSGDAVPLWSDLSGNGNDLAQPVSTRRGHAVKPGLAGLTEVRFTHHNPQNDSLLFASALPLSNAFSLYLMATLDGTPAATFGPQLTSPIKLLGFSGSTLTYNDGTNAASVYVPLQAGSSHLFSLRRWPDRLVMCVDGVQVLDVPMDPAGTTSIAGVSTTIVTTGDHGACRVSQLAGYNVTLSDEDDLDVVQTILATFAIP